MRECSILLDVTDLRVEYESSTNGLLRRSRAFSTAVDGVSFRIHHKEAFGLVGESGSGKSSTARGVLQLLRPSGGKVVFDGEELTQHWRKRFGQWTWDKTLRELRQRMQIIFQDPLASLNPRMRVCESVAEPLKVFSRYEGAALKKRVCDLLSMVGISTELVDAYPHELSGGQGQRVVIARALALEPDLIVADEPVSSLDVSIQAQILNLMKSLQSELGLSYLYISHDLSTVRYMCDRMAVMENGEIVEMADVETIFSNPKHIHTQALIRAAPHLTA